METLLLFLKPYISFSMTGGYSLVQVLDALGYLTTSNGIAFFDGKIMIIYNFLYFILMFFIFVINIIASFSLSNKLALFLFLAWLSPGILQVFGFIDIVPHITTYSIGMGKIGNIDGALISAFLIVILSWSISTILLHIFKLEKKFKAFYDHIWYLFGLSALIFFIYDFDRKDHYNEIETISKDLSRSINILDSQISLIEPQCKKEDFSNEFPTICGWINPAQKYIKKLNRDKEFLFIEPDTPSIKSILNKSNQSVDLLSSEIDKLNNLCKERNYSICNEVPMELNKDSKFLSGEDFIFRGYILPIPQLMPTIEILWKKSIELNKISKEYEELPYKKWLAFMLSAFLIGIKISNSSKEIFKGKDYPIYRNSLKYLFKFIWKLILKIKNYLLLIFHFICKKAFDIKVFINQQKKG